jgi:serine/threonine-protein kinase
VVGWLFGAHHVPDTGEIPLFLLSWGKFLIVSSFFWIFYVALEPYVRRRWPATLVSWSRLLAGGFRDPVVGRDVLAGCLWGALTVVLVRLQWHLPSWLGDPPAYPLSVQVWQLLGMRASISDLPRCIVNSIGAAFVGLFLLMLLRTLLRRNWAAGAAWVLLSALLAAAAARAAGAAWGWPGLVISLIVDSVTVLLLTRLGLLSVVVAPFFHFYFLDGFPLTTQGSAWYAGISLIGILLMSAMALYGFYTSLGGRPVFGGAVLEE